MIRFSDAKKVAAYAATKTQATSLAVYPQFWRLGSSTHCTNLTDTAVALARPTQFEIDDDTNVCATYDGTDPPLPNEYNLELMGRYRKNLRITFAVGDSPRPKVPNVHFMRWVNEDTLTNAIAEMQRNPHDHCYIYADDAQTFNHLVGEMKNYPPQRAKIDSTEPPIPKLHRGGTNMCHLLVTLQLLWRIPPVRRIILLKEWKFGDAELVNVFESLYTLFDAMAMNHPVVTTQSIQEFAELLITKLWERIMKSFGKKRINDFINNPEDLIESIQMVKKLIEASGQQVPFVNFRETTCWVADNDVEIPIEELRTNVEYVPELKFNPDVDKHITLQDMINRFQCESEVVSLDYDPYEGADKSNLQKKITFYINMPNRVRVAYCLASVAGMFYSTHTNPAQRQRQTAKNRPQINFDGEFTFTDVNAKQIKAKIIAAGLGPLGHFTALIKHNDNWYQQNDAHETQRIPNPQTLIPQVRCLLFELTTEPTFIDGCM